MSDVTYILGEGASEQLDQKNAMIRSIIVDDEPKNVRILRGLLEEFCPNVLLLAEANSADQAIPLIQQQQPDLVFLDIQLPGEDGFSFLRSLPAINFEVIFVTAFDQYAIQAIRFSAIDYLLKPISVPELKTAVSNASRAIADRRENVQVRNLLNLLQESNPREHRLAIAGVKETRFIEVTKILRCESANNYTHIFLSGGEKLTVSKPIFEYTELLAGYGFIRCHQSHLVNIKMVRSWIHSPQEGLLLEDGSIVPVSRAKKELVRNSLSEI